MTQAADGHVDVATGPDATQVATDAADGTGPAVISVQPDQVVHSLAIAGHENDPMRGQQWALDRTTFESSWTMTRGSGVIVAVIDSGVEATTRTSRARCSRGKDYVNPGDDGRIDPDGHGTHVAGIIAAHINNGVGIDGAAPGVRILPVRVLDANGAGVASNVAKGIIWAADHGARVINLSLGGDKSAGLQQAIRYANHKRAVVVAAGGNNAQAGNAPMYPAAFPETIAVASVNSDLTHSVFSNTGNYLDVSAPGDTIVSTWGTSPTAYAAASGTSMATPYVAAEAALVIAAAPEALGEPGQEDHPVDDDAPRRRRRCSATVSSTRPLAVLKARAYPGTTGHMTAAQTHRQKRVDVRLPLGLRPARPRRVDRRTSAVRSAVPSGAAFPSFAE